MASLQSTLHEQLRIRRKPEKRQLQHEKLYRRRWADELLHDVGGYHLGGQLIILSSRTCN